MSMTRRSLFGLGAGAVAASVVTVPAVTPDRITLREWMVLDFGRYPTVLRLYDDSEFSHVEQGMK